MVNDMLNPNGNIFVTFKVKHIYSYIKDISLLYLRHIDDIFIIWKDKNLV